MNRIIARIALCLSLTLTLAARPAAADERWGAWTNLGRPAGVSLYRQSLRVAQNNDGRTEAFAVSQPAPGRRSELWHIYQDPIGWRWAGWQSLGAPPTSHDIRATIAVAPNPTSGLEVYAVNDTAELYRIRQNPGGMSGWRAWEYLGRLNVTGNVLLAEMDQSRGMAIFSASDFDIQQTNLERIPGSVFLRQTDLEMPGPFLPGGIHVTRILSPRIERNQDGRLELFAWAEKTYRDGHLGYTLWHRYQPSSGSEWSDWVEMGGEVLRPPTAFTVGHNADGRMEPFVSYSPVIGLPGVQHIYQLWPNGDWSAWASFGSYAAGASDVGAATSQDFGGRLFFFNQKQDGSLSFRSQVGRNGDGGWTGWTTFPAPVGGITAANVPTFAAAQNSEHRIELFALTSTSDLWNKAQYESRFVSDFDRDGLPDTIERSLGTNPNHADLIVYACRLNSVPTTSVTAATDRARRYYAGLNVTNPDGRMGINLIVVPGPVIPAADAGLNWSVLYSRYFPASWHGIAHWHLFGSGGGGQSNTLSDGGASGIDSGWAAFVHEMGHQLGLDHEAHGYPVQSPLHASMMNYAYSYTFNGSLENIQYSDGKFARLLLQENDLPETLPYSLDDLSFLAQAPYYFQMRREGANTQVDWNRNGLFGEEHVRADVNYEGGANLGQRYGESSQKTSTAPWLAYYNANMYVAFGVSTGTMVGTSLSRTTPGRIYLRRLNGSDYGTRMVILANAAGDPTAVSFGGRLWVSAPTTTGYTISALSGVGDNLVANGAVGASFSDGGSKRPTLVVSDGTLYLFLWNSTTRAISYRTYLGGSNWSGEVATRLTSETDISAVWNAQRRQLALAITQDFNLPKRVVLKHVMLSATRLTEVASEFVGGDAGPNRAKSRPVILFDTTRDAGPHGRYYLYYEGLETDPMVYFSMQVADSTFHDGWLERAAYDIWSTTSAAPSVAFNPALQDITYCYRGEASLDMTFSYHGSGVEAGVMGDMNETAYIRNIGLRYSLPAR